MLAANVKSTPPLVILPPLLLIAIAFWGSARTYLWSGGSATLSGFLLYPIAAWWKKRHVQKGVGHGRQI